VQVKSLLRTVLVVVVQQAVDHGVAEADSTDRMNKNAVRIVSKICIAVNEQNGPLVQPMPTFRACGAVYT